MQKSEDFDLPMEFGPRRYHSKSRKKQNENYPNRFSKFVDYDVDESFNKCFSFFCDQSFDKTINLPEPDLLFKEEKWLLEQFYDLKYALNLTKSKLNDLNLKEWHQHTSNTNIAGDVVRQIKFRAGPEFLTQAWCKMYECLMTFWLLPEQMCDETFNSVHLCEAPGAFITALHHYLQTWFPTIQWNWLATTLNPYYEGNPLSQMVQDDRFIFHTLPQWTFGKDMTGNLMDLGNLRDLHEQVEIRLGGGVMLVTADGSIDCQANPAEQEGLVAPLHYCETLTALTILQPGGSFVLKMFTLLECESLCLLYLLVRVFTSVNAFKPVKSKEGNSEVYIVCTGYVGSSSLHPWMSTLLLSYGPTITKAMFSKNDIPDDFITQIYDCAKRFNELQIRVIERNLDLFHNPDPAKLLHTRLIKRQVAERYLLHYQILPVIKTIVGNDKLAETPFYNMVQRCDEGSFNDRLHCVRPEPAALLANAQAAVQSLQPLQHTVCWFMFNTWDLPVLSVACGRPLTRVLSSKFCFREVLAAYNQLESPRRAPLLLGEVETSVTVDVGHLPWDTLHSHCHHILLEQLSQTLRDLPASRSVRIRGLPLLTQFSIAVILLLAHSFYQMGLTVEGTVILCGYKQSRSSASWVYDVLGMMLSLPPSQSVLSLLPPNLLCDKTYSTSDGVSFYLCVTHINNTTLLHSLEAEVGRLQTKDVQ